MAYGAGNHQSDPEKQRQYLEEIARHKEVHPDMLLGVLGVEQILQIDAYQVVTLPEVLLSYPLPMQFETPPKRLTVEPNSESLSDEEAAEAKRLNEEAFAEQKRIFEIGRSIINNTALYDDDTEALIDDDRVAQSLQRLPLTEERTAALRARRTILALILQLPTEDAKTGDPTEDAA